VKAVTLGALAALTLAAASARAQDRPNEQDMFGGGPPVEKAAASPDGGAAASPDGATPAPSTPAAEPTAPPAAAASVAAPSRGSSDVNDRDNDLLGEGTAPQHLSDYIAPENPLQIGGQLYLRSQVSGQQGTDPWTLSSPSLLDVYLDARPNPRVRGFIQGRMSFDPTAAPGSGTTGQVMNGSNGAFAGTSATGFSNFTTSRGPTSILDQMWLRFDVQNRLFITAGKQHVRWGTGRFWQPTDYLHPIKRNPLDVFDARPGQTMLKLHVPWESRGWNFYAFAVTEDPNQATNYVKQVAGGARAEIVLFDAEIGLDTLVKDGQKPRFGVDFSTGIWELDVYADVGIRYGEDFSVVQRIQDPSAGVPCIPDPTRLIPAGATVNDLSAQYEVRPLSGIKTQAVGGVNWSHKYNDNDMFTVGAEYFYNQPGYSDPSLYPGLLFNTSGTTMLNFFYTGRHYGALFASFPAPYSWNLSTFTLSTLGNLSDDSFVSRVDYSYTLLTHITLEAFAGVHYGTAGGEFRLGFKIPDQYAPTMPPVSGVGANNMQPTMPVPCNFIPGFTRDPALIDLGIALRLKI
jgi:hypothetical protein